MITLIWEDIKSNNAEYITRARIPGGWLLKCVNDVRSPVQSGYPEPEYKEGYEWRTSITYIPDNDHIWTELNQDIVNGEQ